MDIIWQDVASHTALGLGRLRRSDSRAAGKKKGRFGFGQLQGSRESPDMHVKKS